MMSVSSIIRRGKSKTIIYDFFGILFLVLLPALSHSSGFVYYYIEPFRIVLIISFIFNNKPNSYFLSLVLPFFSFSVTEHPLIYKSILISVELLLNTLIFYKLSGYFKKYNVVIIVLSILISKIFYYLLKYVFVYFKLINGSLISTDLSSQLIVVMILTALFIFVKYISNKFNFKAS